MVIKFLDQNSSKDDEAFSNAEWGAEAVEAMCMEVRPFKVPGGKDGKDLTIGDYIDRTPKESIGKVMLEEKVFEAWSGGRTVLLGDGKRTTLLDAEAKCIVHFSETNPH